MADLEKLIKDRAYWVAEKKRLKQVMALKLSECEGGDFDDIITHEYIAENAGNSFETCINNAWHAVNILNREGGDFYGFNEILENYGCEKCNEARSIKYEIGNAGSRIGGIHSTMTKIGNRLNKETTQ
jgi:hypothetical protein